MAQQKESHRACGLPSATRWLLASAFLSNIATGVQNLALAKLLYQATGSATAFGLALVADSLLASGVRLAVGTWIDGSAPRRVMMAADAVRGAVVLVVVGLILQDQHVFWVAAAVAATAVAKPIYNLAHYTLAPQINQNDLLLRYNSFRASVLQAGWLSGLALAALVMTWRGPVVALAATGAFYLAASATLGLVPQASRVGETRSTVPPVKWSEVFVAIRTVRGLGAHLLVTSGDFVLVALVNVAVVPLVAVYLHNQVYWLSVLDGSFTVGSLIMGFFASKIIRRVGYRHAALIGLAAECGLFAALALIHQAVVLIGVLGIFGASSTLSVMSLMTSLQRRSPAPIRARIAGVRGVGVALLSAGLLPIVTSVGAYSLPLGLTISAMMAGAYFLLVAILGSSRVLGRALLGE
nr:MFS transporter [Sulfobacillus harzensis]